MVLISDSQIKSKETKKKFFLSIPMIINNKAWMNIQQISFT